MPCNEGGAQSTALDSYRELFERSADAILIIEGGNFTDCNDATVRMLGYATREDVLQTHPSELSPAKQSDGRDSYEKANEMIAIAFKHGSHRFEWDHRRANGEIFPVEVLLTTIREPGRRSLHVVWRDITERRLLEEKLRHVLKMEAIGRLAGGIAHDFNNLLVSIMGHADLLEDMLHGDPVALQHASSIRDAGGRAADLVRQLLAFGRKQQLLPTVLDLNELVRHMQDLIRGLVGESITIELDLAVEPVPIKVDRSQLEQILLNLAANARDAMQGGGQIGIQVSRRSLRHSIEDAESMLEPGDYAFIRFSDTGCGMDSETAEQAFDPFFTTKNKGEGSGLGLATVYGIVKQSKGAVSLHSRFGQGTEVEILFPISGEPIQDPSCRPAYVAQRAGSGQTILLVEDHAAVAEFVAITLREHGYGVIACGDGEEALERFQEQPANIDLILTDVIMPKMGGGQLIKELAKLGHNPKVLYMSGYTNEGLSGIYGIDHDWNSLAKPFDGKMLLERLGMILHPAARSSQ